MDQMKNKLKTAVVVIAAVTDGKVQLAAGITKDLIPGLKAGDLIKDIGAMMGARGGGKPDMAMAGGGDANKIDDALASVVAWVDAKHSA
jgi:alanyl-tRNA synthetase